MTSQGADLDRLKSVLNRLKLRDREAVKDFLKVIVTLLPPSTDYGIFLGKIGRQEYYLDFKGVSVVLLSEDEYLPYLSSNEVRKGIDELPEQVLNTVMTDYKRILKELLDQILDYAKTHKEYYEVYDRVNSVVSKYI